MTQTVREDGVEAFPAGSAGRALLLRKGAKETARAGIFPGRVRVDAVVPRSDENGRPWAALYCTATGLSVDGQEVGLVGGLPMAFRYEFDRDQLAGLAAKGLLERPSGQGFDASGVVGREFPVPVPARLSVLQAGEAAYLFAERRADLLDAPLMARQNSGLDLCGCYAETERVDPVRARERRQEELGAGLGVDLLFEGDALPELPARTVRAEPVPAPPQASPEPSQPRPQGRHAPSPTGFPASTRTTWEDAERAIARIKALNESLAEERAARETAGAPSQPGAVGRPDFAEPALRLSQDGSSLPTAKNDGDGATGPTPLAAPEAPQLDREWFAADPAGGQRLIGEPAMVHEKAAVDPHAEARAAEREEAARAEEKARQGRARKVTQQIATEDYLGVGGVEAHHGDAVKPRTPFQRAVDGLDDGPGTPIFDELQLD